MNDLQMVGQTWFGNAGGQAHLSTAIGTDAVNSLNEAFEKIGSGVGEETISENLIYSTMLLWMAHEAVWNYMETSILPKFLHSDYYIKFSSDPSFVPTPSSAFSPAMPSSSGRSVSNFSFLRKPKFLDTVLRKRSESRPPSRQTGTGFLSQISGTLSRTMSIRSESFRPSFARKSSTASVSAMFGGRDTSSQTVPSSPLGSNTTLVEVKERPQTATPSLPSRGLSMRAVSPPVAIPVSSRSNTNTTVPSFDSSEQAFQSDENSTLFPAPELSPTRNAANTSTVTSMQDLLRSIISDTAELNEMGDDEAAVDTDLPDVGEKPMQDGARDSLDLSASDFEKEMSDDENVPDRQEGDVSLLVI